VKINFNMGSETFLEKINLVPLNGVLKFFIINNKLILKKYFIEKNVSKKMF